METLQEIQQYYEAHLCDKIFQYTLKNGQIVRIRFFRESLCHLLGIQHIVKNKNTLGKKGYENIVSQRLTLHYLKQANLPGYKKMHLRIKYFDQISELLHKGEMFRFYSERVTYGSRVTADLLLHAKRMHLYLHLFLIKENDKECLFVPISFIPLSERDRDVKKYIQNQEFKDIVQFEVIETS